MDQPRRRGALDAAELAEAAVLGDLALVMVLVGWFLQLGPVALLVATIPYAALVARRRLRAAVVATIATGALAFVLGGVSLVWNLVALAALGTAVGYAYRRGWRTGGTIVVSILFVWIPGALVTLASLAVFADSRKLTLKQIDVSTRGPRKLIARVGFEEAAATFGDFVHWVINHWWLTIPAGEFVAVVLAALFCRRLSMPALRRLDATFTRAALDRREPPSEPAGATVQPLPLTLHGVGHRYPGAAVDALQGVDLTITPGTFVAIVGNNGSGKSTLASIIAGTSPSTGTVTRAGAPGIGEIGGTARVFQRPESQVLGARVDDDVRWGLPRAALTETDVDALLARVGLAGFRDRDTSTLSGGELQRLAIASALARRPALLVSDESTAMLDPDGRAVVVEVLAGLRADGTTVVHVTHEPAEAALADVVVLLDGGRVRAVGAPGDVLALRGGA